MDIIFADDARQDSPSRAGMGPLVGIGGISLPVSRVRSVEKEIEKLCKDVGFPKGADFKWSPKRDQWMWSGLRNEKRQRFFLKLMDILGAAECIASAVIEDCCHKSAIHESKNAEEDVTKLFLERIHNRLKSKKTDGVLMISRPPGNRKDEDKFIGECIESLSAGTSYVAPERIAVIVCESAKHHRLLQAADVVASCTVSYVAGEKHHSPPVFDKLKKIMAKDVDRIGGVGLKIHPDYRYVNLYHWLLGDEWQVMMRHRIGESLPRANRPYAENADKE